MADDQATDPDPAQESGDRIRAAWASLGDETQIWPKGEGTCPHSLSWRSCIYPNCVSASTAVTPEHWRELPTPWIVTGKPVGYSSGVAEQEWKALIRKAVPQAEAPGAAVAGLFADFGVPQPTTRASGFDLDNLLDPVLSAVINGRGWFGHHRPNLRWIAAHKSVLEEPAVRLAVLSDPPRLWQQPDVEVVGLDAVYPGDLPSAESVDEYASWVERNMHPLRRGGVGVAIDIADAEVNLGEIANGPIKILIDGLWPILGGGRGAPYDKRIVALIMRKGVSGFDGAAAIKVVGFASQ